MMARDTENKAIGWKVESCVAHNSPIGAADCYPLVQQIAQGLTAQSRVGDRVKPKSLKVHGVVSFNNSVLNTNQDIYVRIIIAAQKNIKVSSQVAAGGVDTGHLLRPGFLGADQQPFGGATMDLNLPVNRDLFRVYFDRTIKLTSAAVQTEVVGMGSVEVNAAYSKRWSYRFKQMPAALVYDAGNGDWANNFAPFIATGYAFSDCTDPDLVTTRIKANVFSLLEFEDA